MVRHDCSLSIHMFFLLIHAFFPEFVAPAPGTMPRTCRTQVRLAAHRVSFGSGGWSDDLSHQVIENLSTVDVPAKSCSS